MKLSNRTLLLFMIMSSISMLAQKNISVEDIYTGAFRTNAMEELQSLKHHNQYTVLNYDKIFNSTQIDLYDFASFKRITTLLDTKNYPELQEIDSYDFDSTDSQLLIANNSAQIYRHSFVANYFLFDLESKKLTRLFDFKIQEPTFSPDGKKIAFVKDNNIFIYEIENASTTQVTFDGKKNEVINGVTDWVYEEEFAFVKAFDWNSSSDRLAYIRFDETQVPEFSMSVFGKSLYPEVEKFKYPKAGEKNSEVSLHLYDLKNNKTVKVDLSNYNDFYIPRIKWTNDSEQLSVQILNRHQDNLDLLFVSGFSGATKKVLNFKDKAYIDITNDLTFLNDNSFIWTSEQSGYNHIYWYDKTGKLIKQVTKGNWEVTAFYGVDQKSKTVFYQSVETGSINRGVYSINLNGNNKQLLTKQVGTNSATFSPNFAFFINTFSSATMPAEYTLNDSKSGKLLQKIANNQMLLDKLKLYQLPKKEFFELKTEKGIVLNAWMIKPKDFDANKKYPMLMYQYSGPGSQQVNNEWNSADDYWFMMLAQKGYIVTCVDGRGTGFKGAEFKKVTQKQLGKFEVEDQIDAAKILGKYPFVDSTRIGIFGWSFGGFMASNCLFKGNDVFKMAIAVAPVTNWRFYDSVYTERYMQTPQENPNGYDENSPINYVNQLKGNFLLIHGSADDNVHLQNSMQMIEALIQANKQFDSQIYPDKNHGIYGGKTRIQLYNKMTNFIKEKL